MSQYRLGTLAIILNSQNKLLLVQLAGENKQDWNFPGGGRQANETLEQTLWREIKEELNLIPTDLTLLGQASKPYVFDYHPALLREKQAQGSPYNGQRKHFFILRLHHQHTPIQLNQTELLKYKWVNQDQLNNYLLFPGQLASAQQAISEFITIE